MVAWQGTIRTFRATTCCIKYKLVVKLHSVTKSLKFYSSKPKKFILILVQYYCAHLGSVGLLVKKRRKLGRLKDACFHTGLLVVVGGEELDELLLLVQAANVQGHVTVDTPHYKGVGATVTVVRKGKETQAVVLAIAKIRYR